MYSKNENHRAEGIEINTQCLILKMEQTKQEKHTQEVKNRQFLMNKRIELISEANKLNIEIERINKILTKNFNKLSLKNSINRIYTIRLLCKGKGVNNKKIGCRINLPLCLANKKVKLRIIKE